MTDIVKRLRRGGVADDHGNFRFDQATIIEAADEIERLQRRLALAEQSIECFESDRIERDAEIERLRSMRECTEEQCPYEAQRAEIERLREAKRRALEMADLRSKENAELRAALQRIVDEAESDNGLTAWDGGDIAREALAVEQTVPEFPVATEEDRKIYDRCREISDNHGKEGDAK